MTPTEPSAADERGRRQRRVAHAAAAIAKVASAIPTSATCSNPALTTTDEGRRGTTIEVHLDDLSAAALDAVRDLFDRRASQGRTATDISDAARVATFGAVDTVLVDIDEVVPGRIDEESGAVTFATEGGADSYGVLDEIARRVLLLRGRVLAVRREDVPLGGPVAAILRYVA